jgi:hypothetical protein
MEPLTITGSRISAAVYLAIALAFVALGVWVVSHPSQIKDLLFGWLDIILFGLGVAVFAWLLVRPQVLYLNSEGFSLRGGVVRAPQLTRWGDVQSFYAFRLPRGGMMIGFNYAEGRRPKLAVLARLAGAEGALPKGWPKSPDAMAAILNDYRERALAFQARDGRG